MYKQIYKVDIDGWLVDFTVAEFHQNEPVKPLPENYIVAEPPHGLYKPKWNGTEWTEGATQEEIDELTKVVPSQPTETELLAAELARTNQLVLELTEIILGGM